MTDTGWQLRDQRIAAAARPGQAARDKRVQFTPQEIEMWTKWLRHEPCAICGGIEGCSHPVPERARAALVRAKEQETASE